MRRTAPRKRFGDPSPPTKPIGSYLGTEDRMVSAESLDGSDGDEGQEQGKHRLHRDGYRVMAKRGEAATATTTTSSTPPRSTKRFVSG